jgi:hypothetical protein
MTTLRTGFFFVVTVSTVALLAGDEAAQGCGRRSHSSCYGSAFASNPFSVWRPRYYLPTPAPKVGSDKKEQLPTHYSLQIPPYPYLSEPGAMPVGDNKYHWLVIKSATPQPARFSANLTYADEYGQTVFAPPILYPVNTPLKYYGHKGYLTNVAFENYRNNYTQVNYSVYPFAEPFDVLTSATTPNQPANPLKGVVGDFFVVQFTLYQPASNLEFTVPDGLTKVDEFDVQLAQFANSKAKWSIVKADRPVEFLYGALYKWTDMSGQQQVRYVHFQIK